MGFDCKKAAIGRLIDKVGDTQDKEGANRRITVYNLPHHVEVHDIQQFFGAATIEGITLYEKMAFIQFKRPRDHTQALIRNREKFMGRPIEIKPFHKSQPAKKKETPTLQKRVPTPPRPRDYHKIRESSRSGEGTSLDGIKRTSGYREHHLDRECNRSHSIERSRTSDRGERRDTDSKRHESSGLRVTSPYDGHHSSRPAIKSTPTSNPQLGSMGADQTWGSSLFPTTSSFPLAYPASNLQKIFADQSSMVPFETSIPQQTLPQHQQVLQPPKLTLPKPQPQVQATSELPAICKGPSDPLTLPPRIKLLLNLVIMEESVSAISLSQAKELEDYIVWVKKEMEAAQANACVVEPAQPQSGESISNESVGSTNGILNVTNVAEEIANKIRAYQA